MITRKALIIVCPGEDGKEGSLPGVKEDAKKFRRFLLSDIGGKWMDAEIHTIPNPVRGDIDREKSWLKGASYSLVVFSGHGGVSDRDHRVYLQMSGFDLWEDELIVTKRTTLIEDSCRTYFTPVEEQREVLAFVEMERITIRNARQIYDKQIDVAGDGIIYMHAASIRQPAAVGPDGSYYIMSLLQSGEAFGRTEGSPQVMDVSAAHYAAIKVLREEHPKATQDPTISGDIKGRGLFPFAVRGYGIFGDILNG